MSLPLASTADLPSADMVRLAHREPPSAGFALPLQIVGWRELNAPKLGFFDVELGGYGLVILNVAAFCLDDQILGDPSAIPANRRGGSACARQARTQAMAPAAFLPPRHAKRVREGPSRGH